MVTAIAKSETYIRMSVVDRRVGFFLGMSNGGTTHRWELLFFSIVTGTPNMRSGSLGFATAPAPKRAPTTPLPLTMTELPLSRFERAVLKRIAGTSVASHFSYYSFGSLASAVSVLSTGSAACLVAFGSLLSAVSVGSVLSVMSVGSILSVGSMGSILSLGCDGGFMQVCW